jgi:SAM-dependent methyltransferase
MTFTDAKQRFSSRAADYVRYRPGYPAALMDLLRSECGLRAENAIADIGSGTGFLSELFLKNLNCVFGVEPNPEMRAAGEQYLRAYANFTSVDGSAETTTLAAASMDFITAGQAFHWFDPDAARREFSRILKPSGWNIVIWNDRRIEETSFGRAYEHLLERFGTDYKRVKEAYPEQQHMSDFFGENAFASRDLPNHQLFDWDGLSGRLRSSSYVPGEGHANFAPMMAELQKIFRGHAVDGLVRMDYFTRMYYGHLHKAEMRA